MNTKTSGLVKITDYDTKINKTEKNITAHDHPKCITTREFNKIMAENFKEKLKQVNLVSKTDFDNKLISFNKTK